jgi:hypothetical protein
MSYLDIYMSGLPNRVFSNVSYGFDEDMDTYGHQCIKGTSTRRHDMKNKQSMSYTPNRRPQSETLLDAMEEKLQTAFTVVLGGHRHGGYDYGPSGSLNGLGAVWDSWVDRFFTHTSNTTSFIFLLDEREFLAQNYTTSKQRYMDSIFVDNLGFSPVDCIRRHGVSKKEISISEDIRTATGTTTGKRKLGARERHNHNHNHNQNHNHMHKMNNNHVGGNGFGSKGGKREIRIPPLGCTNELNNIDQGYRVYYLDVASNHLPTKSKEKIAGKVSSKQAPFIIFTSVYKFPMPKWALESDKSEDYLDIHWRPNRLNKRFNTNYAYTKLTNWYSYHLLNLNILNYFDYCGKIDNDVSFLNDYPSQGMPIPDSNNSNNDNKNKNTYKTYNDSRNIPLQMVHGGHMALATQDEWYYDDIRVSNGVKNCIYNYIEMETNKCKLNYNNNNEKLLPAGIHDPTFWESNMNRTFRSHFMVFWLGLYQSPEVKNLALHWNEFHPGGMWDYRWGDQQWWPRPIAMFTNITIKKTILKFNLIDSDNDMYVKHKEYPRVAQGMLQAGTYIDFNKPTTRIDRERNYNKSYSKFIY